MKHVRSLGAALAVCVTSTGFAALTDVEIGSDGSDSTLNYTAEYGWSNKRLLKSGAGTLDIVGVDLTALSITAGKVRIPATQPSHYRHYRIKLDDIMKISDGAACWQMSEWKWYYGDVNLTGAIANYSLTDVTATVGKETEGFAYALDNSVNTKYCCTAINKSHATEAEKAMWWIQRNSAERLTLDSYAWATANDAVGVRDMMIWQILGSDDETNWRTLDVRNIGKRNLTRKKYIRVSDDGTTVTETDVPTEATYPIPGVTDGSMTLTATNVTIASGAELEINSRYEIAALSGAGQVTIGTTGKLLFQHPTSDTVNRPVALPTISGAGTFVKDSDGVTSLRGNPFSELSNVSVERGTLAFATDVPAKFVRLTFKKRVCGAGNDNCLQLNEFALYNVNGERVNAGLTVLTPGTTPSSMTAKTCCYAENYTQGSDSSVGKLFDGKTSGYGTKMCLTNIPSNDETDETSWRTLYLRLADDARIASYQFWTAYDAGNVREPTMWTMEYSNDGENWTTLDARNPEDGVYTTAYNSPYNGGIAMQVQAKTDGGSTLGETVTLSLTDGKFQVDADQSIKRLIINGEVKKKGTYGSTQSNAEHPDDDHFSGTRVLTVTRGKGLFVLFNN